MAVKASVQPAIAVAEEATMTTEAEGETKAFPQAVRIINSSAAAATVEVGVRAEIAAAVAASLQSQSWSLAPDPDRPANSYLTISS